MGDSETEGNTDLLGLKAYGEAAKIATQGAVDVVQALVERLCYPAARELGLLWKDQVKAWLKANLIRIAERTKKILEENAGDAEVHAHPRMIHDIFEKGSWVDEVDLQEMWAGLLASSCTKDGKDQSNLIYSHILGQMTSGQARILKFACEKVQPLIKVYSFWVEGRDFWVEAQEILRVGQMVVSEDY